MDKKQTDAIQSAVIQMEKKLEGKERRDVFASYAVIDQNGKQTFGNIVSQFYPEVYQNNLAQFIQDLEKSITMAIETLMKIKVNVKVLFFR